MSQMSDSQLGRKRIRRPSYNMSKAWARAPPTKRSRIGVPPLYTGSRTEKKYTDVRQNAVFFTPARLIPLNITTSGGYQYNRIGSRIKTKYIRVHGFISPNGATVTDSFARLTILYDAQTNSALPTWAAVFQDIDSIGTINSDVWSLPATPENERFKILLDRKYALGFEGATGTAGGTPNVIVVDEYIKVNLPTKYNTANAGNISDILTGGLFLALNCNNGSYAWNGTCRVCYEDN